MSFLAGRPLHAFIVRKEPKGHGTGQWIEGAEQPAARACRWSSSRTWSPPAARRCARSSARAQAELDVVHVLALVDREEGGREAVEAAGPAAPRCSRRRDFLP